MTKLFAAAVLAAGVLGTAARADEAADAVIDKAAKALGGADKLKAPVAQTKAKATIAVMGMEFAVELATAAQGGDHVRSQFAGDFAGQRIEGTTVIAGDKGWRLMNGDLTELTDDDLAREKRNAYLAAIPNNPLLLKGKGFKVTAAADEKVGDAPAAVLAGTGPDGKEFKLVFDKGTGLPVKLVAPKVAGFAGDEAEQVWTFSDYKDFGGVKRAAKATVTRDGEKFITTEVVEFKTLDKPDPKLFEKP